jgi:alpha-tubulin suppressor-like RCC1 family protein
MRAYVVILSSLLVGLAGCGQDAQSPNPLEPASDEIQAEARRAGNWLQVSSGDAHSCGVSAANRAYCWGFGVLGNGSSWSLAPTPTAVSGGLAFREVSAGINHSCGVTMDREVWCWGDNSSGQLGDGSRTNRVSPARVAGGKQFKSVDAGFLYTCGVTYPDNLAFCWGDNNLGKLGDGTTVGRTVPTATARGLKFRRVSAGWDHSCGVTTDDRAFCWGSNRQGQVGDGSTVNRRPRPVQVAGGQDFKQVDAGLDFSCAIAVNGRAFCWGDGSYGQLGNGSTRSARTPQAVQGGLRFERLTTGSFHACAETGADRAYCWGHNLYGSLGDGTTTGRTAPVAVSGGASYIHVSAGSFFTCGVTAAGPAQCWGDNGNGQLGDGTREGHSTPARVVGGG